MLYMSSAEGDLKIIILESANIDEIRKGRPVKTADNSVLIAWTPDPVWLADKIMDSGGDPERIAALIDEAAKRQQRPPRPYHKPHHKKL